MRHGRQRVDTSERYRVGELEERSGILLQQCLRHGALYDKCFVRRDARARGSQKDKRKEMNAGGTKL